MERVRTTGSGDAGVGRPVRFDLSARRPACRGRQIGRSRRRNARGGRPRFHKDPIRIGPASRAPPCKAGRRSAHSAAPDRSPRNSESRSGRRILRTRRRAAMSGVGRSPDGTTGHDGCQSGSTTIKALTKNDNPASKHPASQVRAPSACGRFGRYRHGRALLPSRKGRVGHRWTGSKPGSGAKSGVARISRYTLGTFSAGCRLHALAPQLHSTALPLVRHTAHSKSAWLRRKDGVQSYRDFSASQDCLSRALGHFYTSGHPARRHEPE